MLTERCSRRFLAASSDVIKKHKHKSNEMSNERPCFSNPTLLAAPPLTHGGSVHSMKIKKKKILRLRANVLHVSAKTED